MNNKKILGLDIGTTSIGWAIAKATDNKKINERTGKHAITDINNDREGIYEDAVGVRIIPAHEMQRRFDKGLKLNEGEKLTPTAQRRVKRSSRKLKSRYKLRRDKLLSVLELLGMKPDGSFVYEIYDEERNKGRWIEEEKNSRWYTKRKEYEYDEKGKKKKKRAEGDIGKQLYKLRSDALDKEENISLQDWGRILLHLNQWRGYSSDRFKKDSKPSKNYYTVEIMEFDENNFEPIYDKKDKGKKEPLYNKYSIKLKCEDGIEITENDEKKIIYELVGTVFYKNPDIKQGNFIVIKNVDGGKNEKKIATDNGDFTIVNPEADVWNFNKQKLNKSLKEWCEADGTVASYFYSRFYDEKYLKENADEKIERIRTNVVNRVWYEDEFEKIWAVQYPKHKAEIEKHSIEEILERTFKDESVKNEVRARGTFEEQLKHLIKQKIIYYQRPWQQSKNKAGCRFEKVRVYKRYLDKETKTYKIKDKPDFEGRKVIPRSHPLHQRFKIWQQINNVRLFYNEPNKIQADGKVIDIKIDLFLNSNLFQQHTDKTIPEVKVLLYNVLQNKKTYSWKSFVEKELGLKVADEIQSNEQKEKGKSKRKKQGLDVETGELLTTFYSVNFRKQKKDKSGFEDIPLKGNTTKYDLKNALSNWFKEKEFLVVKTSDDKKEEVVSDTTNKWFYSIAKNGTDKHNLEKKNKKGEELESYQYQMKDYEIDNLQLLWEIIYDITNKDEKSVKAALENNFKAENSNCIFSSEILNALSKIKFDDSGMANLSAKAIRKLLPLMKEGTEWGKSKADIEVVCNWKTKSETKGKISQLFEAITKEQSIPPDNEEDVLYSLKEFVPDYKARKRLLQLDSFEKLKGLNYWEAAAVIYGSHSKNKMNKVEKLERISKGKMNNPVVEKIVNETLMLVNDIVAKYGKPDEIRIELSRELRNSADERKQIDEAIRDGNERNELAKKMLRELFNISSASLNDIAKFKVYEDAAKIMDEEQYQKLKSENRIDKNDELMFETKNDKKEFIDYEKAYKEFGLKEPRTADIIRYKLWMDQLCQCPYTGEVIKLSDVFTDKYEVEHIIPKQRYYDNSYSNKVITRKEINNWKDKRIAYEFIVAESGKTKTIETIDGKKELRILEWDGKNEEDQYPTHINRLFKKGRKQKNLLRKEIPSDPIERQLKETQYINKKLKEELFKILPDGKEVQVTTGAITDILRDSWHLNEIMKELVKDRYENFVIGMGIGTASKGATYEQINYTKPVLNRKTGKNENKEVFPGFSKRLDHRHHALDAIIIACTKQWHIQYVNTLNASWSVDDVTDEKQRADKYEWNKEDILRRNENGDMGAYDFAYPWKGYTKAQILAILERVIVSHKNTIPLISPSKNLLRKNGEIIQIGKPDDSISIRASLHRETLIGFRKFYNNEKQVPIKEIVEMIFENRKKARAELKQVLSFNELIDRTVFKERFRDSLKKIFKICSDNKTNDADIRLKVLNEIENNKPFDWAYTFNVFATRTKTDTSGTIDNFKTIKEIRNITDDRIKRFVEYRVNFIKSLEDKISKLKKDKADDKEIEKVEILLKKAKDYPDGVPIYYNAIYDVRIPSEKRKSYSGYIPDDWMPITKLNQELFDKIEYNKNKKIDAKRTNEVKGKLLSYKGNQSWEEAFNSERVFINEPPIIGKVGIKIKKASLKNKTTLETLYLIRPKTKTYVELDGNFRVYIFENANGNREWKLLSNMDAMMLKKENRSAKTEKLYPSELTKELTDSGFQQIFSFGKNDTVFINPTHYENSSQQAFSKEYLQNELFNWELSEKNSIDEIKKKQKIVSENLWQVAKFSDSETGRSIEFISMHTADEIKVPINEVNTVLMSEKVKSKIEAMKEKYNTTEDSTEKSSNKFLKEQIIFKNKEMWQNCTKVYTDKLGKKIVPYWEFPNGCWNKERAIESGLIVIKK